MLPLPSSATSSNGLVPEIIVPGVDDEEGESEFEDDDEHEDNAEDWPEEGMRGDQDAGNQI